MAPPSSPPNDTAVSSFAVFPANVDALLQGAPPAMWDAFAALGIAFGVVLALLGTRIIRTTAAVFGFLVGGFLCAVVLSFIPGVSSEAWLGVTITTGIVFAFITYSLVGMARFFMVLALALVVGGVFIQYALSTVPSLPNWAIYTIIAICVVVAGYFALRFFKMTMIVASSAIGGFIVLVCTARLTRGPISFVGMWGDSSFLQQCVDISCWGPFIAGGGVFALGLAYQIGRRRRPTVRPRDKAKAEKKLVAEAKREEQERFRGILAEIRAQNAETTRLLMKEKAAREAERTAARVEMERMKTAMVGAASASSLGGTSETVAHSPTTATHGGKNVDSAAAIAEFETLVTPPRRSPLVEAELAHLAETLAAATKERNAAKMRMMELERQIDEKDSIWANEILLVEERRIHGRVRLPFLATLTGGGTSSSTANADTAAVTGAEVEEDTAEMEVTEWGGNILGGGRRAEGNSSKDDLRALLIAHAKEKANYQRAQAMCRLISEERGILKNLSTREAEVAVTHQTNSPTSTVLADPGTPVSLTTGTSAPRVTSFSSTSSAPPGAPTSTSPPVMSAMAILSRPISGGPIPRSSVPRKSDKRETSTANEGVDIEADDEEEEEEEEDAVPPLKGLLCDAFVVLDKAATIFLHGVAYLIVGSIYFVEKCYETAREENDKWVKEQIRRKSMAAELSRQQQQQQ